MSMPMKTLTKRQKTILMLVVREYIDSGQAVGSKSLVKNYKLDVSSATVRNEMRALTEMGYFRTTTRRVPTEAGYRYFVSEVMRDANLPGAVQRTISHQFAQTHSNAEEWMTLAASVLAHQTQAVSLVTAPRNEQVLFNKPSTVVSCHICGSKLAVPRGGKADIKGELLHILE